MVAETAASECRSCHAPIVWARTASGKTMPVDAVETPDGNLVLTLGADGYHVEVVGATDDRPRHRPHFATCPDADSWRKRPPTGGAK